MCPWIMLIRDISSNVLNLIIIIERYGIRLMVKNETTHIKTC